ncbi:MAG TPA: CHASE3 domain-containing protein [Rhizomicrobium sp.]|nr:CHASE3 domain-containing protein [Rhizomicrobium sp.]
MSHASVNSPRTRTSRGPLALLGVGALILLIVVGTATWLAVVTARLSSDVLTARAARTAASDELETLLDAETGQRGYVITGDPSYLQPYNRARARAATDFDQLRQSERANRANQPRLDALGRAANDKLRELALTVSLMQAGKRDEAIAEIRTGRGKTYMDQARAQLAAIIDDAEATAGRDLDQLTFDARLLRTVTIVGGLFIVLFAGAAFRLLLRYIREAVAARKEVEGFNVTLEDRVARRTAALTRANEEIQRFAYIVSHDLRAPLVNIMGFTSELDVGTRALQAYFADETAENKAPALEAANQALPEAVGFIRSSTTKMDGLINAILKLSREGKRELLAEDVDLRRVFEIILASVKHQIDETETKVTLSPHLPMVRSDRLSLEQIFSNLVDNALKYLEPGRPGKLQIEAENKGQNVVIKVTDNGRGIAEQDRERVFELFRRAGRQDRPGEGIGLAHVRAQVRRLGGDITVRSKLGEGSEFRVVLPRSLLIEQSVTL